MSKRTFTEWCLVLLSLVHVLYPLQTPRQPPQVQHGDHKENVSSKISLLTAGLTAVYEQDESHTAAQFLDAVGFQAVHLEEEPSNQPEGIPRSSLDEEMLSEYNVKAVYPLVVLT